MKSAWTAGTLGDLCEIYQPKTITTTEMVFNGAYPVYGANGVIGRYDRFNHEDSQLLITCRGATCGSVNVSQRKSWITGNAMVVRPKNATLDPRFLEYLFRGGLDMSRVITGSAQPQITRTNLAPLQISYPTTRSEQQRIVRILDKAFDSIATAKANTEKNIRNARALFESYLDAVFTPTGEDWVGMRLGELAEFRNGINYTKDSKGEVVKIVGVKNFQNSYWVPLEDLDTATIDGALNELDLLQEGDILAVRSNGNIELIGRCMLAGEVQERISHSGFTIRIRLSTEVALPRYICHFMKCPASRKRLADSGTGTNIKSLNQQTLAALCISFPSVSAQRSICEGIESFACETRRLESVYRQKLAALEALKKSLLHQAFSGQL